MCVSCAEATHFHVDRVRTRRDSGIPASLLLWSGGDQSSCQHYQSEEQSRFADSFHLSFFLFVIFSVFLFPFLSLFVALTFSLSSFSSVLFLSCLILVFLSFCHMSALFLFCAFSFILFFSLFLSHFLVFFSFSYCFFFLALPLSC